MSWLSQQNYSLGLKTSSATTARAGIASGTPTVIYTSPPLPKGSYIVIANNVVVPTATTENCTLTLLKGAAPVATSVILSPATFPSLSACVVSDGTTVVSLSAIANTTGAVVYDVNAGAIQFIQLTNV